MRPRPHGHSHPRPDGWFHTRQSSHARRTQPEAAPCEFEANPAITYGGTYLNDSSGALRYVRVQYAGIAIDEDSEFNSITLLGVGAGTVMEHVQVDSGKDDGFEMFGGSVNGPVGDEAARREIV